MYCNGGIFLCILLNARLFCVCRDHFFYYTDILILSNPLTTNRVYWYMYICVEYILTRSASPLDHHEVKMNPMLTNMTNDIFHLIPTILLTKVLALCYPVNLEILAVIYWNSCVALRCQKEKSIDVSQRYKTMVAMGTSPYSFVI